MLKFNELSYQDIEILIISNDEDVRDILSYSLSHVLNHICSIASNTEEALKLIEKNYFKIVFIKGIKIKHCHKLIKSIKNKSNAEIIYIFDNAFPDDWRKYLEIDDDFIVSPLCTSYLRHKIKLTFYHYQLKKQLKSVEKELAVKQKILDKMLKQKSLNDKQNIIKPQILSDISYNEISVLFVDDSESMTLSYEARFTSIFKISCSTACNGREALKLMEKKHFHIVVTDWGMPVMNGFELIEAIKKEYDAETILEVSHLKNVINDDVLEDTEYIGIEALRFSEFEFRIKATYKKYLLKQQLKATERKLASVQKKLKKSHLL